MEEGAAIKKVYLQNKDTLEDEARKVKTLTEDIKEFDKKLSDLRAEFEETYHQYSNDGNQLVW